MKWIFSTAGIDQGACFVTSGSADTAAWQSSSAPCVQYRVVSKGCPWCEGSGWVAIIRSKAQAIAQVLGIEPAYQERENRWE